MSDHLFDESIVDLLIREASVDRLNLAIDRKIDSIFDLDDAMKVQMRGDHITAIGKVIWKPTMRSIPACSFVRRNFRVSRTSETRGRLQSGRRSPFDGYRGQSARNR